MCCTKWKALLGRNTVGQEREGLRKYRLLSCKYLPDGQPQGKEVLISSSRGTGFLKAGHYV